MFKKYYIKLRKPLFWYVRKRINSNEKAEDIVVDVFMKLLKNSKIMQERSEDAIKAWLWTVTRHQIIDTYRKKENNVEKLRVEDEYFEVLTAQPGNYLKKAVQNEKLEMIKAVMEGLEVRDREVISLRFQNEMSFAEIAEVTGDNEGAVKMRLYRALEEVKDKIEKHSQQSENKIS